MAQVFISGASRGLGRAIAISMVLDGHSVVSFSRNSPKDEFLHPNLKHFSNIDATSESSLHPLREDLVNSQILINNVGVAFDGLLATQSTSNIDLVISTNLSSVLKLNKEYIRGRLGKKENGIILNVSSIIGIRGYAGLAAYSASKAGLDGMTRSLARELGPKGFRVNSLLPGYFDSSMSAGLGESKRSQIIRRTPLGRLPEVNDLIPVVKFLVSDDSRMLTGQSIVVDGGITI